MTKVSIPKIVLQIMIKKIIKNIFLHGKGGITPQIYTFISKFKI